MSLFVVVIGTVFQFFLASLFSFLTLMGIGALGKKLFFFVLVTLPLSCFISTGIVIYNYNVGDSNDIYWWYIMPIILGLLYYALISFLEKKVN